jgi:hypothetical protein
VACGATLLNEWEAYRDTPFEFKKGETWDPFVHQGVHLLQRFAQDDRVRVRNPRKDLQIKFRRKLTGGSEFVAYLDAIGEIDWCALPDRLENRTKAAFEAPYAVKNGRPRSGESNTTRGDPIRRSAQPNQV